MNINSDILNSRNRLTMVLVEKLKEAIAVKVTGEISMQMQFAIESIPFKMAEAELLGRRTATLLELNEGIDFFVPGFASRLLNIRPRRNWLSCDAGFVYDSLNTGDIEVSLACFANTVCKKLKSAIVIKWSWQAVSKEYGKYDIVPLLQLRKESAYAFPPVENESIARAALVIHYAPSILAAIENAIAEGNDTVKAFDEPCNLARTAGRRLLGDAQCFCQLLGLEAEIVEGQFFDWEGESTYFQPHVFVKGLGGLKSLEEVNRLNSKQD